MPSGPRVRRVRMITLVVWTELILVLQVLGGITLKKKKRILIKSGNNQGPGEKRGKLGYL